jgi:hypothetical protein
MKILNNIACKLNFIEFIFIEFKWYIELISNSNSIDKKNVMQIDAQNTKNILIHHLHHP